MSLIPVGVTVIRAAALSLLSPILVRQRNIGGFIADVTLEEQHEDELHITESPVDQGASVTDHSFKVPAKLTVRVGYSNSSLQALGNPNYVQQVYDAFLRLQAGRDPFSVITGKRSYTNMLIRRLTTVTDDKTENALMMVCEMKEILLTSTQTVTVPPTANMKTPAATAPTVDTGTKAAAPVSSVGTATGTVFGIVQ